MSEQKRKIKYVDVSSISRKWLDIPYLQESEFQKLDIYLPEEGKGPFPVILSIHGGAFLAGDKRDRQIIPHLEGLKRGYAVVGVNYRLSGEAIFPAGIQDIKAAIIYIKENADKYSLDPQKIVTWGGSAGGYYSAMMALTDHVQYFNPPNENKISVRVQGAVDWFGPTNFLEMDREFRRTGLGVADHDAIDSPESRFLGAKITEIPEKVKKANPITYVTQEMPPMYIQHGSMDPLVPTGQSELLVNRIREVVGEERVKFEILEGEGHGGPQFDAKENLDKIYAFIDSVIK